MVANNDLKNNVTGPILSAGTSSNSEYILAPNLGMVVPGSTAAIAPTTGNTIHLGPAGGQYEVSALSLVPSTDLAALTIVFPDYAYDTQEIAVFCDHVITTLTLTPGSGQTIANTVTAMTANSNFAFYYAAATTAWRRIR